MRNKRIGKFMSILLCATLLLPVASVGMSSVEAKAATDGPQTPYTYRIASNNSNDKHFWYCFAEDADQPKLKVGDVYRFSYYYAVPEGSQFPDSHGSKGSAYFSFKIGERGNDNDWLKLESFQAT